MFFTSNTIRATAALLCLGCLATAPLAAAPANAGLTNFTIDPDHTYPSFEADHMGISIWRGKFNHSSGKVTLDRAAGRGNVDLTVDMASVDFGEAALNKWAVGKDFFDIAHHPKATYKGQLAGFVDGAPTRVDGELTLHGVTKQVALKINSFKCIPHPIYKREMCGADALATIDRAAFGIDAGKDYGFKMDVTLRIQVEALADK